MNAAAQQELQVLVTDQNNMIEQIQKLRESLGNMEHQITHIKSNMRFPELSDNEGSLTVFLKHLKETKDPASKSDSKKPRSTELNITESKVNNEHKIEFPHQKFSQPTIQATPIRQLKKMLKVSNFWKEY